MLTNLKRKWKTMLRFHFSRNIKLIKYMEAKTLLKENSQAILLDVRSIQEYNEYHLTGAICIPVFELEKRIQEVIPKKETCIIIYCQTGHRSEKALHILEKLGYTNLYEIEGGIDNL